jgi:transcriptional regulator with XRE-family HTH domain
MQDIVRMTLEAARVNAGLTQKEAAKLLGISNKTLGDWENQRSYPGVNMVPRITEVYGVPYDHINFLPDCPL